jgi:hypothetical protein
MTRVYIEDQPMVAREKFEELKNAPLAEQRFKFYGNDVSGYHDISRAETDTHVYWSSTMHAPKWNPKSGIYLKKDSDSGCTYDKTTKKFKFWFGKQIIFGKPEMYQDMCKYFGAEWFLSETQGLRSSTTNSVFAKVLLGKITTTDELIKSIIKTNPMLRNYNLDTNKIYAYVSSGHHNRIQAIADYVDVAKDLNVLLDILSDANYGMSWDMQALVRNARMLNRKIDFSWSQSTIDLKREEWTRDVETIREEWLPLLAF